MLCNTGLVHPNKADETSEDGAGTSVAVKALSSVLAGWWRWEGVVDWSREEGGSSQNRCYCIAAFEIMVYGTSQERHLRT